MSTRFPKDRLLQLMAFADGELDGDARVAAAALRATDPNAARLVEDFAVLGRVIQTTDASSPRARAVASFDIADLVMAEVAKVSPESKDEPKRETKQETKPVVAESKPVVRPTGVASLEAARARQKQRMKIGAGVAAALALAASVFLVTRENHEAPIARSAGTVAVPTAPPAPQAPNPNPESASSSELAANANPSRPHEDVEVDAIDSPGSSVSVYYLPSANEATSSVVVWVDETGEK